MKSTFALVFLAFFASLVSAFPTTDIPQINGRTCASRSFQHGGRHANKDRLHEQGVRRILLETEEKQVWFNLSLPIVIPVYWHVVQSTTRSRIGSVSNDQITASIALLNKHYAQTKTFQFQLQEVRQIDSNEFVNIDYMNDKQIAALKAHRVGGKNALNVYTANLNGGLLGFATFPQDINDEFMLDGVVVSHHSLPGGAFEGYNLGATLTHEVGHWLGLWHTFQDGCSFPNDFVADTRPQEGPTSGCPVKDQITCKANDFLDTERRTYYEMNRLLGPDPIHNFMDYGTDNCLSQFTQGQIDRMRAQWYWRQ